MTAASPARDIAQGAKTIATQLPQLRKSFGTGHGRIQPSYVDDELLHITLDATMLWSRWALRRLGPLIEGSLVSLLNELRGATFYHGDLARRLVAADIPALDEADQRRLGAAVARRSLGGTFLVRGEGVVAAAFDDLAQWPEPYRIGLLEGLLLDSDGVMHATEQSVNDAASVVAAAPSLAGVLEEMGATTDAAALSAQLAGTPTLRAQVAEAFRTAASRLPREHRPAWMLLARPLTLP